MPLRDHGREHGLAAVKNRVQVRRQHLSPGGSRHGGEQMVIVATRIVHQHVEPFFLRQNCANCNAPAIGLGHLQTQAAAPVGKLSRQLLRLLPILAHC